MPRTTSSEARVELTYSKANATHSLREKFQVLFAAEDDQVVVKAVGGLTRHSCDRAVLFGHMPDHVEEPRGVHDVQVAFLIRVFRAVQGANSLAESLGQLENREAQDTAAVADLSTSARTESSKFSSDRPFQIVTQEPKIMSHLQIITQKNDPRSANRFERLSHTRLSRAHLSLEWSCS